MVVAVALVAILTASITSTFVEAEQRRQRAGREAEERDSTRLVSSSTKSSPGSQRSKAC
jgi:hypothetical protein